MERTWWKESVVYQIYPRSFYDSNGDGIGDLKGITQKLDHLKALGIDVIWLSPVYASPNDDNGYDISDYYSIMEEFGTLDDFDELLAETHKRGLKLIMDLVPNHTSDEHRWFQESRKSKDNPYRDYYYWKPPVNGGPPNDWLSFFSGSAWEWDETTGEYYLHLFTKKQPDLNWENPKVRQEIYQLMKFWLDKGIDGFRMDVIPLISKRLEFANANNPNFNEVISTVYANGPRVHEFVQEMHREVLSKYDIMTVGEAVGVSKEQAPLYTGFDRNELNMIFHFGHMFMDHGPGGKFDIVPFTLTDFKKVFSEWDKALAGKAWNTIFLDNHDFPRMVSRFGNDGEYRVESAKLLAVLLLSLRGTPYIYQGSEIGMTNVAFESIEDYRDVETHNAWKEFQTKGMSEAEFLKRVHVQGRDNVRTPVQWDSSANAGFTTGTPWIKVNPNYTEINVEADRQSENSVFRFYQKMLQFRKGNLTMVYGDYEEVNPESEELFCYLRTYEDTRFLVLLNFSENTVSWEPSVPLDLSKKRLEISNYTTPDPSESIGLRPFEARVYRI